MTADSDAPIPPVFMHSSTMMHLRVFLMLLVMASKSKGFRLIKSITCVIARHVAIDVAYVHCKPATVLCQVIHTAISASTLAFILSGS